MKPHMKIQFAGAEVSFLPPNDSTDYCAIVSRADAGNAHTTLHLCTDDPVSLGLLHRAIGHILDVYQPGIVAPLPDDSPDLVDAMKILHEIDREWCKANE